MFRKKKETMKSQHGFQKNAMELLMGCLLIGCFYLLSREAAYGAKQFEKDARPVIVIDPGHGGVDPGMIGIGNLEEKGINLEVAEKLKKILESKGYKIVMTRQTDKGLYEEGSPYKKAQDLQRRIEIIREVQPLLTVSIHQNSYEDPDVYGPQVFYYTDSAEGKVLAEDIQEHMNQELEISHPRMPKANKTYYLLKRSPGVLNIVECGFLTNAKEAAQLQDDTYQEKVAQAVSDGIEAYILKKNWQ